MSSDHNRLYHSGTNLSEFTNKSLDELTPAELHYFDRLRLHKLHEGHEAMHAEMLFILLITIIISQIVLIEWKRRGYRSYRAVTLFALWTIPAGLSIQNGWWRFIFFWLVFSCISILIFLKAFEKPLQKTTPRMVYKWFYFIYLLSYALGIIGYVCLICTLFGLNFILGISPPTAMDFSMMLIFYGAYYGVLGRDIAEISSERIARHVGFYSEYKGLPTRAMDSSLCGVCGNPLLVEVGDEGVIENTYRLPCDHIFHEFCIRGWCIVGKKQTCPYCHEKVDLKLMFHNPWEKPHVLYGHLLDWLRLLVAWFPIIFAIVNGINYVLGLK